MDKDDLLPDRVYKCFVIFSYSLKGADYCAKAWQLRRKVGQLEAQCAAYVEISDL